MSVLVLVFSVVRRIFYPSFSKDFEIISPKTIGKMSKERLILERIRSNRRFNEYYNTTIDYVKMKRWLLIFIHFAFYVLVSIMYKYKWPIELKVGDYVTLSIVLVYNIVLSVWVLSKKRNPVKEVYMFSMTTTALRKSLKDDLKAEWRYLDRQNLFKASVVYALAIIIISMILYSLYIIYAAEKNSMYLSKYLTSIYSPTCERVKLDSFGIDFRYCDVYAMPVFLPVLVMFFTHELVDFVLSPPGSSKFYYKQSLKENYIASVYIDNISLSSLNPNQNEAS